MSAKSTYYDVLGVTRAAPLEIIIAVYRAWMKAMRVHPDLGGDEELAKDLNAAYEILANPESRAAYDVQLARERGLENNERVRRAPRFSVNTEVAYCVPPDNRWMRAQAINASALGLKISVPQNLKAGTHITIAFPKHVEAGIEATVKWTKRSLIPKVWSCEAGLEFFSPVPDILKYLS